jgi:hypothetical protein
MVIFHSYVSLPEGTPLQRNNEKSKLLIPHVDPYLERSEWFECYTAKKVCSDLKGLARHNDLGIPPSGYWRLLLGGTTKNVFYSLQPYFLAGLGAKSEKLTMWVEDGWGIIQDVLYPYVSIIWWYDGCPKFGNSSLMERITFLFQLWDFVWQGQPRIFTAHEMNWG